jgi:hypothetical protein
MLPRSTVYIMTPDMIPDMAKKNLDTAKMNLGKAWTPDTAMTPGTARMTPDMVNPKGHRMD